MYIIKNALKCISRSKGRNILIGIIVFAIAVSACIGLSIRQASQSAKTETMKNLKVTGVISFDRSSAMKDLMNGGEGDAPSFDRDSFKDMMNGAQALTVEDYQKYAQASSVSGFYYTISSSLNGSDGFEAVTSETSSDSGETENISQTPQGEPGGFGAMGGREQMRGAQSDFSVVGVSGEDAMTSFISGEASVISGTLFSLTEDYECVISEELAAYNDISVGDNVKFTNPNNDEETYKFKVTGIYSDSSANENSFSIMGATSVDPANKIYVSAEALSVLLEKSAKNAETVEDENTGREFSTAVTGMTNAVYTFEDTDAYYAFEEEVRQLGLEETYTVSSSDISSFENSLVPLNTLSQMAKWFLVVILSIGAVVLIVLNIFNVRERKYEIGVLTAMGMKKRKVALQFLTEIFVVTLCAVIAGGAIGAVSSVPVTNKLLENQVASQEASQQQKEQNFGRGDMMTPPDGTQESVPGRDSGKGFGDFLGVNNENSYVTEISSAMNLTVVWQLILIALLLTLSGAAVSMLFVMRYDPIKILTNRD